MRTRRLLLAVGLALILATPTGLAQPSATIDTQARADGEALDQASPLEPETPITVATNVTTDSSSDVEWRVFVNATMTGEATVSQTANWTGAQTESVEVDLQAPSQEGSYGLGWNVTVESRNTTAADPTWSQVDREEHRVGFRVQEPAPPPDPSDVSVDVKTGAGDPISELGNLTPGEQVILDATVTLPERNDTQWNVTLHAFVNGTRVAEGHQVTSSGGSIPFALSFNVPGSTGEHELSWRATVDYRDTGDESWTQLTTREDSATFTVSTLQPVSEPGLPWGWILGVGAVAVVAGGGAYFVLREPRQIKGEPRSQAMQDLEGGASAAETDEPEVHPQLKILEARAEDLRRMIELARERYDEGEITEHQFETIKEKKEAELEEVEEEMEEYRQESADGE